MGLFTNTSALCVLACLWIVPAVSAILPVPVAVSEGSESLLLGNQDDSNLQATLKAQSNYTNEHCVSLRNSGKDLTLIIMRHAKTEPRIYPRKKYDFGRRLVHRGVEQSKRVGSRLASMGLQPELALVSPSERTKETWDFASESFHSNIPVRYVDALYHSDLGDFLDVLRSETRGRCDGTVIVVGHKPSVNDVIFWLTNHEIVFKTGNAAVLSFKLHKNEDAGNLDDAWSSAFKSAHSWNLEKLVESK
mmetsp:Transcript_23899/g.41113  ORF Transcript_23899/g.41113 Transcript_23899/m.41113 type:complete len:248 (+) Transcript_23899:127-870(+)|eukprot:CAMPEP_0196660328 /NCGR_PEP_ID=MMETSP1086-20130531/39153_1 /TAXON_ID=77921 /ORGANISM="Cyanoptyche  gloeocystis , Strain SAG4.97" /LENGTH=247 /DNA_ID=CAMNT_0041994669 /DNA_START=125 /DNA_END=868 /DNA_ORIENTATION=+